MKYIQLAWKMRLRWIAHDMLHGNHLSLLIICITLCIVYIRIFECNLVAQIVEFAICWVLRNQMLCVWCVCSIVGHTHYTRGIKFLALDYSEDLTLCHKINIFNLRKDAFEATNSAPTMFASFASLCVNLRLFPFAFFFVYNLLAQIAELELKTNMICNIQHRPYLYCICECLYLFILFYLRWL